MDHKLGKVLLFGLAPLLLIASTALASDGVDVKITNDGTDDIVVTVYDMTLGPSAVVLAHARINGFTTVPVSLSPDSTGRGNVSWTATSADSTARKCGHQDGVQVGGSASVTVRADADCGSSS